MESIPRMPRILKSFFFIFSVAFLVWMLFLDANDLPSQFTRSSEIRQLEQEKAFFEQEIDRVRQEREELLTDDELLEKFARERYLMKKPSEDVYVLEEE